MRIAPSQRALFAAAGLVFLLGAAAGIAASLRADLFDDAFITAVFARHLGTGAGLTWVAGDRPFWGPTSLLQTLLLAAAAAVGADLQTVSQLLAALSWAAASGLLVLLLAPRGRWVSLGAGVAMALSPVPWRLAAGMESGLFAALVVLAILLHSRGRPLAAGLAAAAATLTRPEGVLLFALLVIASAARARGSHRRRWLGALGEILPGVALVVASLAWTAGALGSMVPQSIIAKRHFGCDVSGCFTPAGAWHALATALGGARALLLLAAAAVGALACVRDAASRLVAIWGAVLLAALTLGRAPDSPWYSTAALPSLYACAGAAASTGSGLGRRLGRTLVVALLAVHAMQAAVTVARNPWGRDTHWNIERRRLAAAILSDMLDRRRSESRVLAYEVGYLGWSIPGRVDDLLGLVTPGFQPCLQGRDGDDVLAEIRPDYVVLSDSLSYRPTACIRNAPTLVRGYGVIATVPAGWGGRYEVWARRAAGPDWPGASIAE